MKNLSENFEKNNFVNELENIGQLKVQLDRIFNEYDNLGISEKGWLNKVDFLQGRITKEELIDSPQARSDASLEEIYGILDQIKEERNYLENGIVDIGNRLDILEKYQNSELLKEIGNDKIENGRKKKSEMEIEKFTKEEINKSKIQVAHDIRQLTRNLYEVGDITASDGYVYKNDYLINIIVNLKDSKDENLQKVTNIYGLRDKVKILLLQKELGIKDHE